MEFSIPPYIKMGFKPNGGGVGRTYLKCINCGSSSPSEEIVLLRTIYGEFFITVCDECKNPLREIINSTPPQSFDNKWVATHCQICDKELNQEEKLDPIYDKNKYITNNHVDENIYNNKWSCCSKGNCRVKLLQTMENSDDDNDEDEEMMKEQDLFPRKPIFRANRGQ
jgi:hypothetical protein